MFPLTKFKTCWKIITQWQYMYITIQNTILHICKVYHHNNFQYFLLQCRAHQFWSFFLVFPDFLWWDIGMRVCQSFWFSDTPSRRPDGCPVGGPLHQDVPNSPCHLMLGQPPNQSIYKQTRIDDPRITNYCTFNWLGLIPSVTVQCLKLIKIVARLQDG